MDKNTTIDKRKNLQVLATGDGWIAIEKPANLSVHNDPPKDLASILLSFLKENTVLKKQISYDKDFGINAVHRLDKGTSGVLLLACTKKAFQHFSNQFASHSVIKRYIAVLHGVITEPDQCINWQKWDWPLSKKPGGRLLPQGSGEKIKCLTRYKVLECSQHYTMIECEPLTGRKHQIRRHSKLAGHFILGDRRYGTKRAFNYLKNRYNFNRLALHSNSLTIKLCDNKTVKTIKSSKLPLEMINIFNPDK